MMKDCIVFKNLYFKQQNTQKRNKGQFVFETCF